MPFYVIVYIFTFMFITLVYIFQFAPTVLWISIVPPLTSLSYSLLSISILLFQVQCRNLTTTDAPVLYIYINIIH